MGTRARAALWRSSWTRLKPRIVSNGVLLSPMMLRLGFHSEKADLVKCVKSASFPFLINEEPKGHILPARGLGQGDPISPYLFLFVFEGLSGLLRRNVRRNVYNSTIHSHRTCQNASIVSHLLFADDTIIFIVAEEAQALVVQKLLDTRGV